MKQHLKLFSLLLLCFLFSACMRGYQNQDSGQLMPYPIIPHTQEVEVYFNQEKPTDTAYLKLRVIDVYKPMHTATGEMIAVLKQKAQQYGVDALLLLDEKSFLNSSFGYNSRYTSVTDYNNYRLLSAVGIKYKKNISGIENYIQKQDIELYDSVTKTYKPILGIELDLNENSRNIYEIAPKTANYYHNYIKKYSLAWLVKDKSADWIHNELNEPSSFNIKRVYKHDNWEQKLRVTYQYNKSKQIEKLSIKQPEKAGQKLVYTYQDAKSNRPLSLVVTEKSKIIYKQIFNFDDTKKLQNSIFYIVNGNQETPFLRVNYKYFSKNSLIR
jgi:hypothetical protein